MATNTTADDSSEAQNTNDPHNGEPITCDLSDEVKGCRIVTTTTMNPYKKIVGTVERVHGDVIHSGPVVWGERRPDYLTIERDPDSGEWVAWSSEPMGGLGVDAWTTSARKHLHARRVQKHRILF